MLTARSSFAPDLQPPDSVVAGLRLAIRHVTRVTPSHGCDVKRDYDQWFGHGRSLPFGQVHATLSRPARDGKAVMDEVTPGEGTLADHGLFHLEADLRWVDVLVALGLAALSRVPGFVVAQP
jgi:hypothetical protein